MGCLYRFYVTPLLQHQARLAVSRLMALVCWWWCADAGYSGCHGSSWLSQSADASMLSTGERYILSLYFAVVTMTKTGYGDITGHYHWGFIGSICVIIGGMLIFAYALSVLTATLANRDAPKYAVVAVITTASLEQRLILIHHSPLSLLLFHTHLVSLPVPIRGYHLQTLRTLPWLPYTSSQNSPLFSPLPFPFSPSFHPLSP